MQLSLDRSPLFPAHLKILTCCVVLMLVGCSTQASAQEQLAFPLTAKRILFLGDSITHSGLYVAGIETQLRLLGLEPLPEIINVGLGSETCSGLSEPGHPFPRPDVHERLDRALAKVKPDVVVACYGMNDGIYHPFSDERFQAYQAGIRRLGEKVRAAGARLVLLTPPPFDPVPLRSSGKLQPARGDTYGYTRMYEGYDDVLARYAQWIMQDKPADMVIDLHSALTTILRERRQEQPDFTFARDGIHPNAEGHQAIADTVLRAWKVESRREPSADLRKLVERKTALLHDAWLSHIGHQRPGVAAGLPLEEAQAKARELEREMRKLVESEM